jgi:AraC family transcriptional regulator
LVKHLEIGEYSGTKLKEVVQSNFTISATTYNASTFDSSRHYHPNTHLSFVLKGGCEEQKKHAYLRKPFSTTFYHPGEAHQINHIADQSIHVNIEFNDTFFNEFLKQEIIADACLKNISIPLVMTKVYKELLDPDSFSPAAIEQLVFLGFDKHREVSNLKSIPGWLHIAKDFVISHWNRNINLDELAQVCGVHKVTVSKYFAKLTGYTISDFQRQLRINHAISLIKNSPLSLTEIGLACGFSDQSHFIRFFKSYVGFLPKQFERLQR